MTAFDLHRKNRLDLEERLGIGAFADCGPRPTPFVEWVPGTPEWKEKHQSGCFGKPSRWVGGFYWVRHQGLWQPAQYVGFGGWALLGIQRCVPTEELKGTGDSIRRPA